MKIAVVYNTPNAKVLQHRGPATYEIFSPASLERIVAALEENGHELMVFEADRYLIDRLDSFFGRVPDDEWPGLVFNLAFGIQGEVRYCHVPGILEMIGLPYLGSGPLGHALATDKSAAKAIFRHHGLPTPDFMVLYSNEFEAPDFGYPMVVKPIYGASSIGLRLVHNEQELCTAVAENLATLAEPVLVERYLAGREINIGVLGNRPGLALPPVEVVVGVEGPPIYTFEDKNGIATRKLELICPAPLSGLLAEQAQKLALQAFEVLNCRDWARVEMRLDETGQLQLLEVNTIPGLGARASLPIAAELKGMDYVALIQRLVDIVVERYQQQPVAQTLQPKYSK
jgi:D-alanine-D-alanine ligase